ncbi:hypothetical protein BASA50_001787 [Batrachochytrium salamandrivorans]|uniref:Uncharacterized protein n=1 Tax=Batrachochytrium salamandrivorans TaxID=1357716 RepID=A0ABQ8FN30_9FUNG|nr:hypothetical protein BASA50_001787 [Batrachochytrium salamandrivorans]
MSRVPYLLPLSNVKLLRHLLISSFIKRLDAAAAAAATIRTAAVLFLAGGGGRDHQRLDRTRNLTPTDPPPYPSKAL